MPQTTTTVKATKRSITELTTIEISFYDHEIYCGEELIASISHDDDLTQPWVVMMNGEKIHRTDTFKKCHSYITWHYLRETLPVQQIEAAAATTGNEVMAQIADECQKYGFEILDDGIYNKDVKLGEVGCTKGCWWFTRPTDEAQQQQPCDSVMDAVRTLSIVEVLQQECEELLSKPFEELTAQEWLLVLHYQPFM